MTVLLLSPLALSPQKLSIFFRRASSCWFADGFAHGHSCFRLNKNVKKRQRTEEQIAIRKTRPHRNIVKKGARKSVCTCARRSVYGVELVPSVCSLFYLVCSQYTLAAATKPEFLPISWNTMGSHIKQKQIVPVCIQK